MPSTEMEDAPKWRIPKEVPLPAFLKEVNELRFPYKDKSGNPQEFVKWEWVFEITDGEFAGLRAWGETEPKLTNHPNNKVRPWAETLRGAPFEMGDGLNTDDLISLPCVLTVDNTEEENKKTGEMVYKCPVKDVFPADALADVQSADPPF